MLDVQRVIFIPEGEAKAEANARGAIKKIVDRRFTRDDKKQILQNKGVSGRDLDDQLKRFVPEVILPTVKTHLVSDSSGS